MNQKERIREAIQKGIENLKLRQQSQQIYRIFEPLNSFCEDLIKLFHSDCIYSIAKTHDGYWVGIKYYNASVTITVNNSYEKNSNKLFVTWSNGSTQNKYVISSVIDGVDKLSTTLISHLENPDLAEILIPMYR